MEFEIIAEKELRRLLDLHVPGARVLLFGSRAKGNAFRRSDWDLAVDRRALAPVALSNLREAIENSNIIYQVDVVDLSDVDETWRNEIEQHGVPWKN